MTETKILTNGFYTTTILRIQIGIRNETRRGFASTRKDPNGVGEMHVKLIGISLETFGQELTLITYTKDAM